MKDLFSTDPGDYQRFRPVYPDHIFSFILKLVTNTGFAWDVGTGNGQVASVLSQQFSQVVATDISEMQLAWAKRYDNINYYVASAENSGLTSQSADLITVAQAIHWFDIPVFEKEVQRILKPGGIFCYWGYALPAVSDPDWNSMFNDFYKKDTDPFWEPERGLVDNHYLDLPFSDISTVHQEFEMQFEWTSADLIGYMSTWSALKKMRRHFASNPLSEFELRHRNNPSDFQVTFPVFLYYWRNQ